MQGESEEDMAKYTVDYTSGATGYGWTREYDCLDEFEYFINEKRNDYTAKVRYGIMSCNALSFGKEHFHGITRQIC